MTPRPDIERPSIANKSASIALAGGRLLLGYMAAVAAGAILFAILLQWTSAVGRMTAGQAAEVAIICFVFGLMFAAPYTVIACVARSSPCRALRSFS